MIALLAPVALLAAATPAADAQITAAMEASAAGWNAGELDRFMAVYADDAVYVTPKGLVRGKAAIAERYRPSFTGGGNARGKLSFQPLAFRPLSAVHELLWAKWTLTSGDKTESGYTSLVFERRRAGWRIVSDHSS